MILITSRPWRFHSLSSKGKALENKWHKELMMSRPWRFHSLSSKRLKIDGIKS